MADKTFDVVIVGGGNKALILAMYLAKYGKMEVGILEARHEIGGGWSQEEPAAGFIGYPCSMHHMGFYHTPVYWDFPEWKHYGARYDYSNVSVGCAYKEDDSCFLQYNAFADVDPDQEKTAASIAQFSNKDADAYLQLWKKYKQHWESAFWEHFFNPAPHPGEPDAMDRLIQNPEAGIDPLWLFQSPLQMYEDIFEDPHMQHAFGRINQSAGVQSDLAMAGFGALYTIFCWTLSCWATGGSHVLAHASHKVIIENGGKIFQNALVDKILVENGTARGVKLSDGTEVEARKMVVTDVDPYQLCFELLDPSLVPAKIRNRVKSIERDWIALMWYTWALKEKPRYKCESFNPDAWECMWLTMSDMDRETFKKESSERKMYQWPSKLNIGVAYHGQCSTAPGDSLLAPPDTNCVLLTEQFVVPAWSLTEEEWKIKERQHAQDVVKTWGEYTTNVNWDIISGYTPITPFYTANMCKNYAPAGNWCVIDNIPSQWGKFRPIPELARHKVPNIEGLYCTGSAWPPWGSAHSAQGYNCYKVIAEDLSLPKPWEKDGRPF